MEEIGGHFGMTWDALRRRIISLWLNPFSGVYPSAISVGELCLARAMNSNNISYGEADEYYGPSS